MIFNEGDPGSGFYIVEQGRIKVFKLSIDGKEQILHIYGRGRPFGEVPVFEGKSFPASAMAIKESTLLYMPRDKFVAVLSETPALAMNMLGVLSKRLREFTIQIENLALKEVPARIASYLVTLMREQSNNNEVLLPVSKVQLASLIGTTPETLSRIFKKMSEENLIGVAAGRISIKDYDGLVALSGAGTGG